MKTTVSFDDFYNTFNASSLYKNNFSHEWLIALFDYFESLENDCDISIEFDMIAIACEYTEYESLKDFHNEYDKEKYPDFDSIEYRTQVIYTGKYQDEESPFIIQSF